MTGVIIQLTILTEPSITIEEQNGIMERGNLAYARSTAAANRTARPQVGFDQTAIDQI